MLLLTILETEIKPFMNQLLKESTFHSFEVRSMEIGTFVKFEINGILDKDFLPPEEKDAHHYATWAQLQSYVFQIIKGSQKPKYIKIVFSLPSVLVETIHPNGSALFLNMVFENNTIQFMTATAQKNFSLDKSLDVAWESYVKEFFQQHHIAVVAQDL